MIRSLPELAEIHDDTYHDGDALAPAVDDCDGPSTHCAQLNQGVMPLPAPGSNVQSDHVVYVCKPTAEAAVGRHRIRHPYQRSYISWHPTFEALWQRGILIV